MKTLKKVDTHAHVFSLPKTLVEGARYRPDADALLDDYLAHLDQHGMDYGVLVQPSFLGFDNEQMLAAIARHPKRLKGIAVLPLDTDTSTLVALASQGIVGARLNLFGKPLPDFKLPVWQRFLAVLGDQGWQLELHCPPAYLRVLLPALHDYAGPVVIDHFGRPDPEKGTNDEDYQTVLDLLNPVMHWIKVSGYYRLGAGERGCHHAQQAYRRLVEKGMGHRLVWGSDWPHTQHGDQVNYDASVRFLDSLVSDATTRMQIMGENALNLFNFAP
ncbi:amidohydrolase [Pusillimonas sp. ANT_WB101]|uniref:amidohydrolase family protein n=1 Tax=Pusillimonas sp. ANT_WB101 TaxID=2597356 RepID=UPI0011EFF487|nr:amidohydrolase family protein [Pusillimonas sp. ANT_WB101]KAA0911600.1 amidohydrolase family protein [Pusillimonas sp. ANT_WB101]